MELWVRSQDKTKLLKVNGIYIHIHLDFNSGGFGVYTQSELTKTNFEKLGIYSTKERALEVLDEIQKILLPKIEVIHNKVMQRDLIDFSREIIIAPMIEDIKFQQARTYVYQMPKE